MSYTLPTKSPFSYSVGIGFHTNMCSWYPADRTGQVTDSQDRLEKVVENFKLVRIYGFFTAGWLSTGTLDPCAEAFVNVLKNDTSVEGMISTTDDTKDWFKTQANVNTWVAKLKSEFGTAISQIKCILIANEINALAFTESDIKTIFSNFKANADFMALNIPISVSFSTLPVQSGDNKSDKLVKAVVDNWASSWNGNHSFVFIDPYPDAKGINNAAGVFDWQSRVKAYYAPKHPSLQIFIAETGAEGYVTDSTSVPVIESIMQELDKQHKKEKNTVPTFFLGALDEQKKKGSVPAQNNMGLYTEASAAKGSSITIKNGITIPSWVGKK